ncbi:mucin-3A [Biomphalaria glabrata]|nr:mucin-3A-like [Biomphalaria glabrata]
MPAAQKAVVTAILVSLSLVGQIMEAQIFTFKEDTWGSDVNIALNDMFYNVLIECVSNKSISSCEFQTAPFFNFKSPLCQANTEVIFAQKQVNVSDEDVAKTCQISLRLTFLSHFKYFMITCNSASSQTSKTVSKCSLSQFPVETFVYVCWEHGILCDQPSMTSDSLSIQISQPVNSTNRLEDTPFTILSPMMFSNSTWQTSFDYSVTFSSVFLATTNSIETSNTQHIIDAYTALAAFSNSIIDSTSTGVISSIPTPVVINKPTSLMYSAEKSYSSRIYWSSASSLSDFLASTSIIPSFTTFATNTETPISATSLASALYNPASTDSFPNENLPTMFTSAITATRSINEASSTLRSTLVTSSAMMILNTNRSDSVKKTISSNTTQSSSHSSSCDVVCIIIVSVVAAVVLTLVLTLLCYLFRRRESKEHSLLGT